MFFSESFKKHKATMEKLYAQQDEAAQWIAAAWEANKKAAAELEHKFHSENESLGILQAEIENLTRIKKLEEERIEERKVSNDRSINLIKEENAFLKEQNKNLLKQLGDLSLELAKGRAVNVLPVSVTPSK